MLLLYNVYCQLTVMHIIYIVMHIMHIVMHIQRIVLFGSGQDTAFWHKKLLMPGECSDNKRYLLIQYHRRKSWSASVL
jgi:hypothetical protein